MSVELPRSLIRISTSAVRIKDESARPQVLAVATQLWRNARSNSKQPYTQLVCMVLLLASNNWLSLSPLRLVLIWRYKSCSARTITRHCEHRAVSPAACFTQRAFARACTRPPHVSSICASHNFAGDQALPSGVTFMTVRYNGRRVRTRQQLKRRSHEPQADQMNDRPNIRHVSTNVADKSEDHLPYFTQTLLELTNTCTLRYLLRSSWKSVQNFPRYSKYFTFCAAVVVWSRYFRCADNRVQIVAMLEYSLVRSS